MATAASESARTAAYSPPAEGDASITTPDTEVIIRRFLESKKSLASDHIESFDSILDSDLRDIFERVYRFSERTIPYESKRAKSTDIATVHIKPQYSNIRVHPPRYVERATGIQTPLTPAFAHMNNRYYVAPFTADFAITLTATKKDGAKIERKDTIRGVEITSLPIITGSKICPTNMATYEIKAASCEDPLNPGGYYILGSEWISRHLEALKYNELRIFNSNHEGTLTRAEMLSKVDNTNGNSAQFIISLMDSDALLVEIVHKPLTNFAFPFFVMFRLLGLETHKEMMDTIVYEYDSPISRYIQARMTRNFFAVYKQFKNAANYATINGLRDYIITEMGTEFNKADAAVYHKNKNVFFGDLYRYLDLHFMPHIGQDETHRPAKARALGGFIRMLWLVECGVYPETDRDSEVSKRNERSGQRMVKMLKTYINSTLASPLLDAYEHALTNMAFEDINLKEVHNNACDSDNMKKTSIKLISGGTKKMVKTGMRRTIKNRLSTQMRPAGYLGGISQLRDIVSDPTTASSKASEREHTMRQIHESSFGYKDPVQTQENENIGRNKQMTATCSITSPCNIAVLLNVLMREHGPGGLIIRDPPPAERPRLTRVSINWAMVELGYTAQPYLLVDKYRHLRRTGKLDRMVSIIWNERLDMVVFYCDGERMVRPMCIVQNNYGDSYTSQFAQNNGDLTDFEQWSLVRRSHIDDLRAGRVDFNALVEQGVMEFVDPEEQWFETVIAHSPEHLAANARNHLVRYTHVEMPAALYGIPTLFGSNFNMNDGTRNAYASAQCQQAAGEHASNWRFRKDKGISLQTYNELPPVRTIANTLTISTGVMHRHAIICDPYNQEDSLTFCNAIVQSGKLTTEYLEKFSNSRGNDEEFRVLELTSSRRKIFADFSAIDAATGMPAIYSVLRNGSVVIPKVHKVVDKHTGETTYEDRSSIYTHYEPAIVIKTNEFRNEDDILIREVFTVKMRNPVPGDKFTSRHGQKGVMGAGRNPNDMPFESDGATPDTLGTPYYMPTRMTSAQPFESVLSLIAAQQCTSINGTVHTPINMREIPGRLTELGFAPDGTAQMFDGATGIAIKTRISVGLVLYQNIQKNVRDKRYAVDTGPTDLITHQPLEGKAAGGSLRIGEMERDVLIAIGCTLFMTEKLYFHSNQTTIYICENCGTMPTVNTKFGVDCLLCGDNGQVYAVDTTWASLVFLEEMRAINIKVRFELENHIYYKGRPALEPA